MCSVQIFFIFFLRVYLCVFCLCLYSRVHLLVYVRSNIFTEPGECYLCVLPFVVCVLGMEGCLCVREPIFET